MCECVRSIAIRHRYLFLVPGDEVEFQKRLARRYRKRRVPSSFTLQGPIDG